MHKVTHQPESTRNVPALYMSLELGVAKWELAFGTTPGGAVRRRTLEIKASQTVAEKLATLIADAKAAFGLPAAAPVRSCYEAGRDGFWVHRLLATLAVENCVVDSSSIEVNRRARQAKTDRLDATRLLRMLMRYWGGEPDLWHVCWVPSVAEEDARHQTRLIATLTQERTRWRNRIHAALILHGVRMTIGLRFPEKLAAVRDWNGQALPTGVVNRILQCWTQLEQVTTALRAARRAARRTLRAAQTEATQWAARVHELRGVGQDSALRLAHEIVGRGLKNRRQVGALTGLAPLPHGSGETQHDQGISRSGNGHVSGLAVELAWVWVQWQPDSAITRWYRTRWANGGRRARKIGIVAVARKLLIALWRYGAGGTVPTGAKLRTV